MLNTNISDSLEKILDTEKSTYVTNEKEIYNYITSIGEIYSDKTLHDRLNQFKKCMYYCSSDLSNPMFLSIAQEALELLDEFIYIHKLMYRFLCDKHHNFLSFDKMENITCRYENTSFSWHIPKFIMPILASYILAANSCQKFSSATLFFQKMEEYIAKSSNDYNEDIKEIYSILAKEYLGKEYFCALDVLYKTYAATSEQQKIIWGSIIGLTYMLIESPVIPSTIPSQVCTLLEAYKKKLDAHPSKDLTPFYIHNEPFKTDKEDQLIKYITDTFSSFPDTLLTFIKSSVNRKSKYKISVDDFSSFEKNFKNHINDISAKIEESREYIINTYHTIQHDSAIVKAVHENRLIFETAIFNKHINFLTSGISKYHERLLKDFSSFLTKVRQASKENPEKQPSLSIETDYLKKLETDIQYTYSILKQHLETGFKNLSPFLTLRRLGYIETFKYPIDCFLEKDFLRITHELKKCYVGLSDEYVIHQCKSRGLRFPLSRYDMIRFLLERV